MAIAPVPLNAPPKLVVLLLLTVKVPLFKLPAGKLMMLPPSMIALPPTVKLLFARVVVCAAVNVPPFRFNTPLPNGLLAFDACKVPLDRVT